MTRTTSELPGDLKTYHPINLDCAEKAYTALVDLSKALFKQCIAHKHSGESKNICEHCRSIFRQDGKRIQNEIYAESGLDGGEMEQDFNKIVACINHSVEGINWNPRYVTRRAQRENSWWKPSLLH